MKKHLLVIAFFTTFSSFCQSPVEYMNSISADFKLIQSATWDYSKSQAKNKSARAIDGKRVELVQTIKTTIAKVKKVKPFKNETYYRDTVLAFLEINLAVVSFDYEKLMNLQEISESSYDAMDAYLKAQDVASEKLAAASERVDLVEKKFAKENNINLIESTDKVGLKLKKAGEMYDYYNPVYLIFFKAYKQEAYLMEALIKGDVSGMEQNKSSLSKVSAEGIAKMASVQAFNKDLTLKTACLDMLKFYAEESDKHFQKLIDFETKKKAFEKAKLNMESKKEKDRTQKDVDDYNKMINEFNKASNEYNAINNDLNNRRNKLLNAWNNTSENFTSKNI
jgi:hypothetical protein